MSAGSSAEQSLEKRYTSSAAGSLTKGGCYYKVPNVGLFTTKFNYAWDNYFTLLSTGIGIVEDLVSSIYTVEAGNSPLSRRFDLVNIGISLLDPSMTLTVPGGQKQGPISSAQFTTAYDDILYGSVRTVAKISSVPGTTHGFSFYSNDSQEIDFAFLTSSPGFAHLTNEQVSPTSPPSSYQVSAPNDATTAYHEYRVDWIPEKAQFFIDGKLVQTITDNVPTTPGFWLWNNWSNGNAWAQGPPAKDSVLKIRSIDGYFNRTSVLDLYAATPLGCNI
ncbi:concanavalin A-like lectin/glucanase [Aureobasidium namibiae CBS 147.97]|uniref:Concanavalin A-like lectin/glucanase n=1 Tax=Aureobasidium namibiae CBS 147.97 TaxID=1043004 RepID=A0A074WYT4_9PEZI|nr:concanavalin A-like lectin/glucanase [Aureobasidium namibiae CBS 147.97]KEQ74942.1 concanavalin A-like lectin/glucanase [Aureobasidium namibiae CBS 147.97]